MSEISDERPSIRQRLPVLIPLVLIALIAAGNVVFGLLMIRPAWQEGNDMQTQIAGQEVALTATVQAVDGAADVLLHQVENAQEKMADTAGIFLTAGQADDMLDLLYSYAQRTGVEIAELQLETSEESPTTADTFSARTFQIRINGEPRRLLQFIVQVKEASVPGVNLSEVVISREGEQSHLSTRLILYTSPYASGTALENLPTQPIRTPNAPPPTPIHVPATATPQPTLTPTPAATFVTPSPTIFVPSPTLDLSVMRAGVYNDDSPLLQYTHGNWIQIASLQGTNASYRYSAEPEAEVTFAFEGTAASIQYVSYNNFGIFEVYVDGVFWTTVDSYASTGKFGQEVTITGLPYDTHTVVIRNSGRQNPASEGSVIALDAVKIGEAIPPTATPALENLPVN